MHILPIMMGLFSGICFYVGISHVVAARRVEMDKSLALFALFSFLVGMYGIETAINIQVDSPHGLAMGAKWDHALLAMAVIVYSWFVLLTTGFGSKGLIVLANAVLALAFIVNLFSPYSYQFASLPAAQSFEMPWGEVVWHAQGEPTPLFGVGALVFYLVIVYSVYAFARMYRVRRTSFALWMFLATLPIMISTTIGILGRVGSVEIPQDGGLSVMLMTVVMGAAVSRESRQQSERLQRALYQSETLNKAILDYAGHAIVSGTPDGLITSFNPAAERMLGYTAPELIGRQTPAIFHDVTEIEKRAKEFSTELGTTIEPGFEVFVAKARRNLPNEHEWTYIRKDGRRFPVLLTVTALYDDAGDINGFLGLAIDISERKQAEVKLQESERRLKRQQDALIKLADYQAYATRDIERVIAETAETVAQTLGVERVSVWRLGNNDSELCCLDLFELAPNKHTQGVCLEGATYPNYFTALNRNEVIAAEDARIAPETREFADGYLTQNGVGAMLDAPLHRAGIAIGVLCCEHVGGTRAWETDEQNFASAVADFLSLCMELHEHEQTASELERHRESLEELVAERTNELEAANRELTAFSYSVSHDLRAPLRAVDGFSRALMEDHADSLDDTAHEYLRRVRSATQRMGMLIDDMLQLSRISRAELKPESVDMSAMAAEIVTELRAGEPERQVEVHITPNLVTAGDSHLLRIALANLLDNSWKYTGRTKNARIELDQQSIKGEPVFYVRDNGAGFDMKYADKLFGAFQRLHGTEFPGTGIGLATVARVIHRHGGQVWAEAETGKGATFYFTINANVT